MNKKLLIIQCLLHTIHFKKVANFLFLLFGPEWLLLFFFVWNVAVFIRNNMHNPINFLWIFPI